MSNGVKTLTVGSPAPDFCLPDKDGGQVCTKDLRGRWVVVYFYPKDNTSGCTLEAVTFTGLKAEFEAANAVILGVSPDSQKSHCNFADKHGLTITLLSDPEKVVLSQYGVWQIKKMYGKEYFGVVRSTFLIDSQGVLVSAWTNVKVKGHVEEVLAAVKQRSAAT